MTAIERKLENKEKRLRRKEKQKQAVANDIMELNKKIEQFEIEMADKIVPLRRRENELRQNHFKLISETLSLRLQIRHLKIFKN